VLESAGVEVDLGLRPINEMLLPARDQRLLEPGPDRFARIEPQPAGAAGERENALRMRRSQPLEIER
jgi:hypothetical protein